MEVIAGIRDKHELHALNCFLHRFRVVHLTTGASARAVGLMERYRLSHGLILPDVLLAATALESDLPLLPYP